MTDYMTITTELPPYFFFPSQAWVEVAAAGIRLFLTVVYITKRTQQHLLTVAVSFQRKRADNRIFNLRVIGPASMRLAL